MKIKENTKTKNMIMGIQKKVIPTQVMATIETEATTAIEAEGEGTFTNNPTHMMNRLQKQKPML